MSNHASESEPGPLSEHLRKAMEDKNSLLSKLVKAEKLGATGKFPEGKLSENDEGEIRLAVTIYKNEVVLSFGKAVEWVGFTPELAHRIADTIHRKADEIATERKKGKSL